MSSCSCVDEGSNYLEWGEQLRLWTRHQNCVRVVFCLYLVYRIYMPEDCIECFRTNRYSLTIIARIQLSGRTLYFVFRSFVSTPLVPRGDVALTCSSRFTHLVETANLSTQEWQGQGVVDEDTLRTLLLKNQLAQRIPPTMKTFTVAAIALAATLGADAFSTGTLPSQRSSLTVVNGVSVHPCIFVVAESGQSLKMM